MAPQKFNIRDDDEHFPSFEDLPEDNDIDMRYYDDLNNYGVYQPTKHWCLLVEIVDHVLPPAYIRPVFSVKDKKGTNFSIFFHLERGIALPKIWEKHCKTGSVMAIMYANSHQFMDGQLGIRVEELSTVKIIPCSLNTLFLIGDNLDVPSSHQQCGSCKKDSTLRCSRCSVVAYCDKDCQVRDWKLRHKEECVAYQQVVRWKGLDWDRFKDYEEMD